MKIQRATPFNEFLAKLIFLVLPTAGIGYFLLENLNEYYAILKNDSVRQALFLLGGMGLSSVFHSFRFRFLPPFLLGILVCYFIYSGLDNYAVGEFDAFFISRRFQVFAILFGFGWLLGWGFTRIRYWSILIAISLLSVCIVVIAKSRADSVPHLLFSFAPALLYAVYLVFTAEQIYNFKDKSRKYWLFLSSRILAFGFISMLLLGGVIYRMKDSIKAAVANYGGGGASKNDSGMTHKNPDGSTDLNDFQRLRGSQGRGKELLFCAHIENYFPGTNIPNPLYLTSFYFTKFDTATETFERDNEVPYNDLFEPHPNKMPLFATAFDSSVFINSLGDKYRDIVSTEVYSKSLDAGTYLAPNAGFFVQPITVEKDFRQEFKTAFRAKSYSSLLNSAYFVYNINKPEWRKFQEMRNTVLRKVTDYSGVDSHFMRYYTYMPANGNFARIAALAHHIMDTASTPVDRVLALRDYFLSKDENGDALYHYSDNPGEPDIPNASKLMYFLFENHKGYCAYYAGATLFMLRAMGIPSRIAVGFLTENRADKNKCWYWYYAKQAHAWVQVYFPGLGWLDFDTTVGNDEARESPTPDGTPPMQPPRAWLALEGVVNDVDTLKKVMTVRSSKMVFHDKEYTLPVPVTVKLDVKIATIYKDSLTMPLADVRPEDEGTIVSYAEALKNIEPTPTETGSAIVKRFPTPVPVDEVYLKRKDIAKVTAKTPEKAPERHTAWRNLLIRSMVVVCAGVIILFIAPFVVLFFLWFSTVRAQSTPAKAYWAFMYSSFYLHMVGIPRRKLMPLQYAVQVIEPRMGQEYAQFIRTYLKVKYAHVLPAKDDDALVNRFPYWFRTKVRSIIPAKTRISGLLRPLRCVGFFSMELELDDWDPEDFA